MWLQVAASAGFAITRQVLGMRLAGRTIFMCASLSNAPVLYSEYSGMAWKPGSGAKGVHVHSQPHSRSCRTLRVIRWEGLSAAYTPSAA